MQLAPADSEAADAGVSLPQYSRTQVDLIWGAEAVPMALLGWIVNPLVAGPIDGKAGIPWTARVLLMTLGLAWQFVMVLLLVRHEARALSWRILRDRLWLCTPRHPRSGFSDRRLWWWLVPLVLAYPTWTFAISPIVSDDELSVPRRAS